MRLLEFEPLACGGSNACQYDLGPGWKRCQAAQVSGDHCSIRDPPDLGTVFAKCAAASARCCVSHELLQTTIFKP